MSNKKQQEQEDKTAANIGFQAQLRHSSTFTVLPYAGVGTPVFHRVEESKKTGAVFEDTYDVAISGCASCGAAMHNPQEIGGSCFICQSLVCKECAQFRCVHHGKIVCQDDAIRFGELVGCRADNIFRLVLLALRE
ncbi:hypothetical protein MYX77_05330 [Acidobacteriia bacterium AH_259_A11_L15]|nr:hypothetical protein [Acidobacteriia bacterium AH_259_A11_L15]